MALIQIIPLGTIGTQNNPVVIPLETADLPAPASVLPTTQQIYEYVGNDLSTPRPEFGFVGLQPGDHWCLCASRFAQAHDEGCAPRVNLAATHSAALDIVPLDVLQQYASDG